MGVEMRRRFRPLPSDLREARYGARYRLSARFYGLYTTLTGKRKRFSYVVNVSPRTSNKRLYSLMVTTCNNLLNKKIPQHYRGQVFPSFSELLHRTRWFRVRKLNDYHAGVIYEQ